MMGHSHVRTDQPDLRGSRLYVRLRTTSSLVTKLEGYAGLVFGTKRSVHHSRRTARIHSLGVQLVPHPLASLEDVHFFPEVVNERLRIVGMRRNPHDPRDHHFFWIFAQDSLYMAGRRSRHRLERQAVHRKKFQFGFRHLSTSLRPSRAVTSSV